MDFRKGAFAILVLCFGLQQCSQINHETEKYVAPPEFSTFIKHQQERQQQLQILFKIAPLPLPLPLLYKGDSGSIRMSYKIVAGKKALGLIKSEMVLRNPYSDKPFPLSNSVILQSDLVTLFEPGYFACYNINNHARNKSLERQLNSQKFQYHWIIGDQLVGLSKGKYYAFTSTNNWVPYTAEIPFNKQPKLFEDEQYMSFMTCNGEFGGEVYFYDKLRRDYYMTGATCPNSVFKLDGKYFVLSSLGHMMGSAGLQMIADPTKLRLWKGKQKPQDRNFSYGEQAPDSTGASHIKSVFSFYDLQMFSTFKLKDHQYYMIYWQDQTFLATIQKDVISLVDPLFNNAFYTHNPITINYSPNLVLMNLDFYGVGKEKEVACIIIVDNKLTKINWSNEKY